MTSANSGISAPLVALLALGGTCSAGAQSKRPAKNGGGLGMGAIRTVESATGKKLSAAQKAQIVAAAREREKNIAAARKQAHDKYWKVFRARVAKAAGMSLAQLEAKQKAARAKQKKR